MKLLATAGAAAALGAGAAAALGVVFVAYSFNIDEVPHSHQPDNPSIVQQGKRIYEANCASCHGKNLQGKSVLSRRRGKRYFLGPAHDQRGHTWKHSHKRLFEVVKYGSRLPLGSETKASMPSFKWILSDNEIWAVLSYIEAQWPEDVRAKHDAIEDGEH